MIYSNANVLNDDATKCIKFCLEVEQIKEKIDESSAGAGSIDKEKSWPFYAPSQ